jgi:hypothetical protein
MAITGISSYDGKQIIAAGAQSATKAYQDSNGGVITSKYQTTADMSNYQTIAGMSNYATTASVTGKQDALTFGYIDDQISQINGSGIYSQGGGGGVVTATGGDGTYVQTINGKNISATNAGSALSATNAYNLTNTAIKVASATSASTAYTLGNTAIKVASATSATNANTATYASNGVSLNNIYNSARSGYAASAYIAGKQIVNGRYVAYDSYNNPNWWTGNNIFGLKLNSASVFNSTGISVEGGRIDAVELGWSGNNNWLLHVNFVFNKFIPINTATWNTVTTNFFSTTGHFVAPIYAEMYTNWGAAFGAAMIDSDTLWTTAIKLNKFEPWTGYTSDKVFLNFTVPWVNV